MLRQYIDIKGDFGRERALFRSLILPNTSPGRLGFYMNKHLRFIILLLLVSLPGLRSAYGQAAFASEEELKQQALKLFEDDEFEEAYPLYSQLASLYPKDPNYNYRLGVCMLYASDDKEKAIPFLEYAAKKPDVEKEVLFYLAKAYHLNYRFDDAIAQYLAYLKVASEAKAEKLQVDRQIEMCKNGKKLLRNITDLVVIEKKELSRADFYRAYDISDLGGKLLTKPDEAAFRTSLDKKKKERSIIYLASNNNQVYFSSYGDDLEHGKDIYIIRKLPNGEWSKPQTLGYPVNTEYDEDYPFLHPNGKVLYFCSKGHNSMGGYDIFKTTLNEETNTWNKPVNLDFPINTPDDDILYVTNEDEKEAYFSSARSSKTGKTAVFHINVERRPIDVAIVKGMVIKTKDNQALDVKITVKDLGDNTILGIYNAKESGSYLVNLPNGGRFMYTVEAAGFNTQSEVVVLPTQYEFKPLKQEISYEPGTDKLIVKNLFDEPVDDQSYLLALNFIKEKSKLEAGVDAANAAAAAKNNGGSTAEDASAQNSAAKNTDNGKAADNSAKNENAGNNANSKASSNPASLSNDAIVKIAYDDAKEAEKEAKDLQEQADIALNIANQKNELAQNKTREATQLMSDANSMSDNVKKQAVVDEANMARIESEELNQETVAAFNIAKKLQQKAAAKDEEADLSLKYAKDLEAAVKSKNPADALAKLEEQEKLLEALSEKNGTAEPDNIYAGLKMDADVKKRELDKATQASADIKQEIADNLALMETLKTDAEKTKKEDLKQGLLDQIAGLRADNEQSRKDLEATDQKVAKLTKEYNGIKNEMDLVSNVVDKAKTGTNEDAAASVAAIDKSKLEQQVNEIKSSTPDNSTLAVRPTDKASADNSKSNPAAENKATDVAAGGNTTGNKSADNTGSTSENKAADNSSGTADNASTAGNTNGNTGNSTDNTTAETKADYAKQYNDQLATAEAISNPLEKENKKAELYKDWTAAISTDIANKKEEVKAEKDKAKKKELNAEIAALEKELKSKQSDEKAAITSAEKLKSQEGTLADNSSPATNSNGSTTGNDNVSGSSNSATAGNPGNTNSGTVDNSNSAAAANNGNNGSTENASSYAGSSIGSINSTFSDKLAEAEKIGNAGDREAAKAGVLKEWSAAITASAERQKQDMNASTDPEMKALLAKKISDAEALAKEKQTLAAASTDKANALKGQDVAVNSGNKSAASSDGTATSNGNTSSDQSKTNDVVTGTTGDQAKANDAAAGNVAANSKSSDAAVDPGNKNSSENNSADNTNTTANAGNVSPAEKLDKAIAFADKSGTELQKETKKKEAYLYYIADMNDQLTAKETELKGTKDKAKKKELNTEIAAIRSDIKDKQKTADDVDVKIKELQSQPAIASSSDNTGAADNAARGNTNNSGNSNADNPNGSNTGTANTSVTGNTSTANDNGSSAGNTSNSGEGNDNADNTGNTGNSSTAKNNQYAVVNYTDAAAIGKSKSAAAADKEAEGLIAQANELKSQAAEKSSQQEKDALYVKANELMEQADAKKIDAAQLSSDANKSEFIANKDVLNQIAAATPSGKSDQVVMAEMMKDESNLYFDKAQQSRTLAASVSSPSDKLAALEDAAVNEKLALDKQRKATDIYKKANPGFVAVVNAPDNTGTVSSVQSNTNTGAANTTKAGDVAANSGNTSSDNAAKNNGAGKSSTAAGNSTGTTDIASDNSNTASDNGTSPNSAGKSSDAVKGNDAAANETSTNGTLNSGNTASTDVAKNTDAAKTNDIASNQAGTNTNTDNTTPGSTSGSSIEAANTDAGKATDVAANETKANPDNNKSTDPANSGDAGKAAADASTSGKASANTTSSGNSSKVVLAPTEKFVRSTQPVYSAAKPIPVNETLPDGLIYKVQIGAFRNPISPEQFKGMSPITAETTPQGFTRYTAGLFTRFSTADQVKNEIRELGYKDAFVVVFLNGKRISVAEALKLQGEDPALAANNTSSTPAAQNPAADNTGATTTNTNPSAANSSTNAGSQDSGKQPAARSQGTAAAENVAAVGGLFYTVQVGVYSQPVSAAKLYNIQPLYAENTANGNIRYNTGIYNSVARASEAKNVAVNAGVKDAFVTAYYQGKRISLAEAAKLEAQGGSVFSTAGNINQLPSTSGRPNTAVISNTPEPVRTAPERTSPEPVRTETVSPVNTTPAASTELKNTVAQNNTMPVDTGIVFKVQIGAFKDEVPLEIANQFLKIANRGIKNYKDANGLTIYTVGNFKTYDAALSLKNEIIAIVKDAFIVAYNNGNKISVEEAKTLETK
ncbi:MAG: WD40-like beta Propeller containing protein [Bacteroidetes bacterium]|nr:WD40-like beta Propeller containing protein [Bacteroidota bacterium]